MPLLTELESIQNSQDIIEGKVCGKVKGGFTVELMTKLSMQFHR